MGILDSLKPVITNVVSQFGTDAVLIFDNPGVFDVEAGKTEASETEIDISLVFEKITVGEINQGIAQAGDRKVLVANQTDFPRHPRPSDRIRYHSSDAIEPVTYRITSVDPTQLTDEVGLFTIYLRR